MLYTHLRSFHAVATQGGFTAAGRQLHIGQPTVTRQVRELEDRFGIELFHRRGRHVEPTDVGHRLLEITRRMFSMEREALDLMNAAGGFHTGHLSVGAVGPYHVTEMLADFRVRYPGLSIAVEIGNSRVVRQGLLEYRTDVAVLAQIEADPRFHALPYAEHPVVAFVSESHRLAARRSVSLADLARETLILGEPGSSTRRALEAAMTAAGLAPRHELEIGSREAIWWAVLQGLGVGVVSEYEFIPHPDLRRLRLAGGRITTAQYVVCLQERREERLLHAFLEIADAAAARRHVRPA